MLQNRIRFISAQPDQLHFVWQTYVYLQNYLSLGLPAPNCIALFGAPPGEPPSDALRALQARFPDADIRHYEDTRDEAGQDYPPSIQPHLIGKALADSPEWEGELCFFQDCDVVFRHLPDFDRMLREHPRACLLSDTLDYIGFEHLHGRCEKIRAEKPDVPTDELIHKMCEIVGIDVGLVRRNEKGSGGAQYLLQGVGRPYWEKVYRDSVALFAFFKHYLGGLGLSKPPKEYVQIWTAGMWAYLWNLWLAGRETVVHPEMKFLFSGAVSKEPAAIVHMAGLHDQLKHNHFDKQDWWELSPIDVLRRQPYLFDHFPEGTIAREYATWIHRAAGLVPRWRQPLAPAKRWRLLAWKTESKKDIWDVERVRLRFEPGVSIVSQFDSGCAGKGYEVARAFDEGAAFWGGRPERRPGCQPCFYLGVELDRAAVPEKIELTQREGPHAALAAIVQFSNDGEEWVTGHVAPLNPHVTDQTILYRSEVGRAACGWRIVARTTSSGFGWDIARLSFLRERDSERGEPCSSGHAFPEDPPQYGPQNAFQEGVGYWGGRANGEGLFTLGLEAAGGLGVNRVLLEQGDDHWAPRIEIQVQEDDGRWVSFREVDNLGPGLNDILLFEVAERQTWTAPRLAPEGEDRGSQGQ